MLELLITLPNILASIMCMFGLAYQANILFSIGFIPFIYRNYKQGDKVQLRYFIFLWVLAVVGVILHWVGWSVEDLMELI
jgi:uncharacterized membrane protein